VRRDGLEAPINPDSKKKKICINFSLYTADGVFGAGILAVFSAGQEGMGQRRNSKRGIHFNTTYVIFFTKYEKHVVKTIQFDNIIDKFTSVRARKVSL
jgi:hypothetical protein